MAVGANQAERETAEIYEEFGQALLRYAAQLVSNHDEARDAVQEVFLRYFVERRYGREIENPRAWLYLVLRNYLLDRIKSAPSQREVYGSDLELVAALRQDNPEELVQRSQTAREIARSLSSREYTCLTLRGEGLSYLEIADAMEIRTGTVGALLARAQSKLRCYGGPDEKRSYRGIGPALLCLVQEGLGCATS